MLWIDEKYLLQVSSRFRNFKRKARSLYNWSCHECGDSKKNSRTARAYAFEKDGKLLWHCHNCGAGGRVSYLVKQIDESLYREMLMEQFADSDRGRELDVRRRRLQYAEEFAATAAPEFGGPSDTDEKAPELLGLAPRVVDLPEDHPAVQLVLSRRLPKHAIAELFHTDEFFALSNRFVPGKYDQKKGDEPRLVIPFTRGGRVIGFQGRSYGKSAAKYISVVVDAAAPFLYGWDRLDGVGDCFVFEGPIDSMFLRNGLATGGGVIQMELAKSKIRKDVAVIVYDNEPRNRQVVRNMVKAVHDGWRVAVWPEGLAGKDVNELVMNGVPAEQVEDMLARNVHAGLAAELAINSWKRVRI